MFKFLLKSKYLKVAVPSLLLLSCAGGDKSQTSMTDMSYESPIMDDSYTPMEEIMPMEDESIFTESAGESVYEEDVVAEEPEIQDDFFEEQPEVVEGVAEESYKDIYNITPEEYSMAPYYNYINYMGMKVPDRVFFNFDSSSLSDEGMKVAQIQVDFLKKNDNLNAVIEGYCDERGSVEYNLALGERRSDALKSYLVSNGISPDRITVVSYGKEKVLVPGSKPLFWKQNRASVLVLR